MASTLRTDLPRTLNTNRATIQNTARPVSTFGGVQVAHRGYPACRWSEGQTMGYELWTSSVTGYRRRGTRLSEIRSLVSAAIQARAILEPLQCCPVDAPAKEMQDILEQRGFDVAGVQERRNGSVIGYVDKEQLNGARISDHI